MIFSMSDSKTSSRPRLRRVASYRVVGEEGVFSPGVVEIVDGEAVRCYGLEEELPFTEWLDGTVEVVREEGGRHVALLNGTEIL